MVHHQSSKTDSVNGSFLQAQFFIGEVSVGIESTQ